MNHKVRVIVELVENVEGGEDLVDRVTTALCLEYPCPSIDDARSRAKAFAKACERARDALAGLG